MSDALVHFLYHMDEAAAKIPISFDDKVVY